MSELKDKLPLVTPSSALKLVNHCYVAGQVLNLVGKPGNAKTYFAAMAAAELTRIHGKQFYVRVIMLSQKDYTDLAGLPVISERNGIKTVTFVPMDELPKEGCWVVLLDEYNRCGQDVANASLQLLQFKKVGNHYELPKDTLVMCTGNLGDDDNTIVRTLDSAMHNRILSVQMQVNDIDFTNYMRGKYGQNCAIANIIEINPSCLNETPGEFPFATPRSLEDVQILLNTFKEEDFDNNEELAIVHTLAAGRAGGTIAAKLLSFLKYRIVVKPIEIIEDLEKAIPKLLKIKDQNAQAERATETASYIMSYPENYFIIKAGDKDADKKKKQIKNICDYFYSSVSKKQPLMPIDTTMAQLKTKLMKRADIFSHLKSDERFISVMKVNV